MKHILFVALLAFALMTLTGDRAACQEAEQNGLTVAAPTEQQLEARKEITSASYAYSLGKHAEAQRHSERALELDPNNKSAPLFIARSIHAQYLPGIETPENIAKAREAINAYQRILQTDPVNEEAYKAVAALYGAIKEEERQREWIAQRAANSAVPNESRAEAYTVLASKDWNCSYDITEQAENKRALEMKDGRTVIRYRMPKDEGQFLTAQHCATRGLAMIEMALSLSPQNDTAWSFKDNLLREMVKLAEMSGQHNLKDEYTRQSNEARKQTEKLNTENRIKGTPSNDFSWMTQPRAPAAMADPALSGTVTGTPHKRDSVSGGILNGRAITLPKPRYTSEAREARASGTVTVQILIDETGQVIKARAVSGHPLLQPAALEAARQAQFSPTILSRQAVKVSGVLTYKFMP